MRLLSPSLVCCQSLQLCINRSDYMLHEEEAGAPLRLLQVEFNTIAASFAALGSKTSAMHRYICSRHLPGLVPLASLPVNRAYVNISSSIAQAVQLYRTRYPELLAGRPVVVVMIVQAAEANAVDQKLLEYDLFE